MMLELDDVRLIPGQQNSFDHRFGVFVIDDIRAGHSGH